MICSRASVGWLCVVLLLFCGASAAAATYSGGSGTQADPYQINSTDNWLTVTSTSADWSKHFRLTADLDFGGTALTPIALGGAKSFTGTFDGNGHVVRNAVISRPDSDYVGVFGYVGTGAEIRNLGVENIAVTGGNDVGGLVGYLYFGAVTSCYATGAVTGSSNSTGGLVGECRGTVTSCYVTGRVTGGSYAGGLIGVLNGTVTSSYATGAVSVTGSHIGGLVGYSYGGTTVSASYWDKGTSGCATSAGGEGRTTAEMTYPHAANTYVGWDFTGTWAEDTVGRNKGYPYLQGIASAYLLTYAAGQGGTVEGDVSQTVPYGGSAAPVQAMPATGYKFVQWSDGVATATRQDTDVTHSISVTAEFAADMYTLVYSAGPNGIITGDSSQSVAYGGSGTAVAAEPDTGYRFVQWSDGSTDNPRTDTNVTASLSVSAVFAVVAATHVLFIRTENSLAEAFPGVAIAGDRPGTTDYEAGCADGESVTLTAPQTVSHAGADYAFQRWVVDGADQSAGVRAVSITVDRDRSAVAIYRDPLGPAISGVSAVPTQVRAGIDNAVAVMATADDSSSGNSKVSAAECFVDSDPGAGYGISMLPADGAFDSPAEAVTAAVPTSTWIKDTTHRIYVRAQDAPGNWGDTIYVDVPVVGSTPPASAPITLVPLTDLTKVEGQAWQTIGAMIAQTEEKTLDLGIESTISAVSLTPGTSLSLFPRNFTIVVSRDGAAWTLVAAQRAYAATRGVHLWQFKPTSARYVKASATSRRSGADNHYYVSVADIGVYTGDSGGMMQATWTATADDGNDPTSGPASVYDLRISAAPIADSNFDTCRRVAGLPVPGPTGHAESMTFPAAPITRTLYAALKVGDKIPDWSGMSTNHAKVRVLGLKPKRPANGATSPSGAAPSFTFALAPDTKKPALVFSNRPDFPAKPITNSDGTIGSTIRIPIKAGARSLPPGKSQWIAVKKLVGATGRVYWRLEGASATYAHISGPTRTLLFATGDIGDLTLTQAPLVDSTAAVWPDKNTRPTFHWTNATVGMKSFFVDISIDPGVPLDDPTSTAVLGAGRITGSSYKVTSSEWLKMRKMAAANGGVLYWRVRAADSNNALKALSDTVALLVDGGSWRLSGVDLKAAASRVSWSHDGYGIVWYDLQFSCDPSFAAGARTTVVVPTTPILRLSYRLKATDLERLANLAKRNGGVTTLYYRVRGQDADKAFVTYSPAQTTEAP